MKELTQLVKRDLILGFNQIKIRSLIIGLIILNLAIFQIYSFKDLPSSNFNDLLFYFFRGTTAEETVQKNLPFPFMWFMIQFIPLFLIGDYVYKDMYEQSSFIFTRLKRRFSFWISKWIFSMIIACSFILLILGISVIGSRFFLTVSINIHPTFWLLPIISSIIHVTIYVAASSVVRPIFVLFALLSFNIISVYTTNPLLPGNYSMVIRHIDWSEDGFTNGNALVYFIFTMLLVVVIVKWMFKRIDIYQKSKGVD